MTDYLTNDVDLKQVADAIRAKGGTTAPLVFPDGFSAAVGAISTAPVMQEKAVTITENGTSSVTPDDGKVLSKVDVTVNVPATPTQEKTVSLSMAGGDQMVTPSEGKVLTKVSVQKPATLTPENVKKDVDIGGVIGTLESGGGADTAVYRGNLVATTVTSESIVFAIQEGQFPVEMMLQIAAEASQIFIFSTPGVIPANGFLYKGSPSDSLFIVNANAVDTPSYEVDASNNAIVLSGLSGAGEAQVGSAYFVHYVAPSLD